MSELTLSYFTFVVVTSFLISPYLSMLYHPSLAPGEGAQWSNFHKPASVDDNFTLLDAMIMLLIDTVIHLIITWYLDNVRPGEFGVPKPLYFCFTVSLCPRFSTSP